MVKSKQVAPTKPELKSFLDSEKEFLTRVSRHIISEGGKLEPTWSGSWAGYHANLYFKNYQVPSADETFDSEWGGAGVFSGGYDPGWQSRSLDDVWGHIMQKSPIKFNLDDTGEKLRRLQELMEEFKLELELETNNEVLLKKIKDIKTNFSMATYIHIRTPNQIVSRDSKAIHQGMRVPPHVQCLGFGHAIENNLQAAKELLKLSELTTRIGKDIASRKRSGKHDFWHYSNPFWLITKASIALYDLIINNKARALVGLLLTLLTLLAIDYSLAWSNTRVVLSWFGL